MGTYDPTMDKPSCGLSATWRREALGMRWMLTDSGEPIGLFPSKEDAVSFGERRLTDDAESLTLDLWELQRGEPHFRGSIE